MTVTIDGVVCGKIKTNGIKKISCTTGARIGAYLEDSVLDIRIAGNGRLDNGKEKFRYVSLWS